MIALAEAASVLSCELWRSRSRVAHWIGRAATILRRLGPYAAIEILLPGGTLMALLLWLYRRWSDGKGSSGFIVPAFVSEKARVECCCLYDLR
jgi:hypothetical protein